MEFPAVVSQDLEEFDPEAKLKNDEEQGINIETMSLSGNDSDLDQTDDFDDVEDIENESDPIEKLKNDVTLIENKNQDEDEDNSIISENLGINLKQDNSSNYSSESDEDSDDNDYYENMKKIDQDINKDILFNYHPETKQINYKELLTLSNVVKNKKGDIIDPLHKTIPFLTCYEKAKILGMRAKQINNGSTPFVDVPKNIIDGHIIALMELNKKKIPFIIRRPIPNGGSEYWKVSDLKILE